MINVDVTFLYIIVVFLLASGILKRYLFTPLAAILEQRESEARSAENIHAESLASLSRTVAEAEEKLSLARREALKVRESLRAEGAAHLEKKLAEVLAAAQASVLEAARAIDAQAAVSSGQLPGEARSLARNLAEKILGRKLAA
jgi:F-type H+-transporting ATPase subunit b